MIYVSGKMTGVKDFNYPEFNRVTRALREVGHSVVNPVEICSHLDGTVAIWQDYMDICMPAIEYCSKIYLLEGWEDSKGARQELKRAIELDLKIIIQNAM